MNIKLPSGILVAGIVVTLSSYATQDNISKTELLSAVTHIRDIQGIITDYLEAHDQLAHTIAVDQNQTVYACAFSPNSAYFAYVDRNYVKMWDTKSPGTVPPMQYPMHACVNALAFDPLSNQIAAAADKRISIWHIQTGAELVSQTRSGAVTAVAFSPDNRYFASATSNGSIKICAPATYKTIKRLHTDTMSIQDLAFSAQSNNIIAAGFSDVQIFDVKHGKLLQKLGFCAPLVLAPPRNQLALFRLGSIQLHTLDQESDICLPTAADSKKTHEFKGCNTVFAFGPHGRSLATGMFGTNQVCVWDTTTGNLLYRLEQDGEVEKLAYSPDGKYLACATDNKTIVLCKNSWVI